MGRSLEFGRSFALVAGALVAVAVLLPVEVAAQTASVPLDLNRMHDEAISVAMSSDALPQDLLVAAARHGEVANYRSDDDPRLFSCLETQAALAHAVGDLEGALEYLVRAADHARATGDVLNAATAYTEAAIVAQAVGDGAKAAELADRARLLAKSPYLSGTQAASILHRINVDAPSTAM
jgi:tetratricopeptide (TPR) repeat protein